MCRIFAFLALAVSATPFGSQSASAAVQIVSNFESDADGWTVVNLEPIQVPRITLPGDLGSDPPYEHDGTISGGYPADGLFGVDHKITGGVSDSNYIFRVDPTGQITSNGGDSQWSWFNAPSKFLGDLTYATTLSFYLNTFGFDDTGPPVNAPVYSSVILVGDGPGEVIYQVSAPPSPTPGWSSYSFNFTAGTWYNGLWFNSANNNAATPENINNVLEWVTGLYISLDWYTDPTGSQTWPSLMGPGSKGSGLDNVLLQLDPPPGPNPLPEPSTLFSFCFGTLLLAGYRWRSQRRRS